MNNKINRKVMVLGIIILFIGVIILPSTGRNIGMIDDNSENSNVSRENYSGGPQEEWNITFGGTRFDVGLSAKPTLDGGYIIGGVRDASGWDVGGDGWLIKTDSKGNEEWNKTYGGSGTDKCGLMSLTSDGGYILTGGTTSFGAGNMDVWLIKTNSFGNEIWNKSFGGADDDQGVSVQQTSDGGYIISGLTRSYGAGDADGWLIKTDSNGNKQWSKIFGDSIGGEYLVSVQQTTDGGYIATGRNYLDNGWSASDTLVIKTDSNGNVQWEKRFGGPYLDTCLWIQQTRDGGYILTGQSQIYSSDEEEDLSLIKIDSNGNEEWSKYYGERDSFDSGTSVEQTIDGGFIATGLISNDAVLIKTDSNGNTEWSVTFGGSEVDEGFEVHQTSDRGFIVGGLTESYGSGDRDVWLVKFDAFENLRPNKPSIPAGSSQGKIGEEYAYTCIGTDPDGDQIYYMFDWGDGADSGWIGPYNSGEECSVSHIWNHKDNYEIKVKTKDIHEGESEWSDPLPVSMPKNKILRNHDSLGLFDWFLTFLMKIGHFPSLSACIISNDEVIWSKGCGFYDLENRKSVTKDTLYNIASISKTITSTALMQLYEQGLFDLDDDVNDHLPFSMRNPNFPDISITFRMLLSHQSSLSEDPLEFYQYSYTFGGDSAVPLYPFLETYLVPSGSNYTSEVWSNDSPGETFHYANIGFALIGFLVEQISGKPFDQYCIENIFLPLKMYNTSYRLSDINIESLAVPYDFSDGDYIKHEQYGYIDYPAGTVRTSISELSHFLVAHMNKGTYNNIQLLSEETVNLMHSVQYSNSNYGLGWGIFTSSNGNKYIGHQGGDFGIVTSMYIRESDNVAVIIFVNVSPWTMNAGIWYLMQDILFMKSNSIFNSGKI